MKSCRHLKLLAYRVLVYCILYSTSTKTHCYSTPRKHVDYAYIPVYTSNMYQDMNTSIQFKYWSFSCYSIFGTNSSIDYFHSLLFSCGATSRIFCMKHVAWSETKIKIIFHAFSIHMKVCFIKDFMIFYDIFKILELYSRIRSDISRGFDLHRTPMR